MKKFSGLILLIATLMIVSFTACDSGDTIPAETDPPAVTTEAPAEETTEAPAADGETTEAPAETEASKGGCGSAVGFGAVAVMAACAAFVATKKD